jgi:cell division protein FtsB
MDAFVITWKELLIAAIAVLSVYAAEILLLMRFGQRRGIKVWRRGVETRQQAELEELKARVDQLEASIKRLGKPDATTEKPAVTPYSQAIQLAQQGFDVTEVALSCGISRAEAELIVALYRSASSH